MSCLLCFGLFEELLQKKKVQIEVSWLCPPPQTMIKDRGSWSKVNYFPMIHLPESEKRQGFYVMIIKLERWCEIFLCHHVAGMLVSRGAGDPGSIPGLGRSPGKGNGNPLQCSCLENSMDRGAWWPTVHGITTERLILSLFRCIDNGEIFLTGPGLALIKSSIVNVDVNMDFVSISQHQRETFYDPMDFSTPGFPVLHHLLEFAQTHVHWVSDATQPSHSPSSPSPPAFNLSQHQGLFQWVSSSPQVAKVLELQLQHQSFRWIFRTDLL